MGMKYVVGYNPKRPMGSQWQEIFVNSSSDIFIYALLTDAIKDKYPEAYEKISEQRSGHFVKLDELAADEFMRVVVAVRDLGRLADVHRNGFELWESLIEPLVMEDERYVP